MVCMKSGEELYCNIYQSPILPRVTLLPNLNHEKSDDRENEVRKHRETCGSNRVDFRIPGIPHSEVEQVESNRKEKFRQLIEQFESHPNRNMFFMDFKKSEEINHFSRESKDLITEMGNNEIFEFCETSSRRQCSDCALYWEIGVVYCTCGKCLQPTAMNRQYNKDRFDSLSIPGYVIRRTNLEVLGMVNHCVKQCVTKHVIC